LNNFYKNKFFLSRDTTIRVWSIDGKQLHSFGGHSSTLTCVKFWPYENYKKIIESLKSSDEYNEDVLPDLEESESEDDDMKINNQRSEMKKYPLVISCSLDCSMRLWSIYKGRCIKQFYLYNPINNIDILNASFLVALGKKFKIIKK
jgi:WD40 repeat protein